MKKYFNKTQRENIRLMLLSNDLESIRLALDLIMIHPNYFEFKYNYCKDPYYKYHQIWSICVTCVTLLNQKRIPYGATILSYEFNE